MSVIDPNFLYPNPNSGIATALAYVCLWNCDSTNNQIARQADYEAAEKIVKEADLFNLQSAAQDELTAILLRGLGDERARAARDMALGVTSMLQEQVYHPEALASLHHYVGVSMAAIWDARRAKGDIQRWKPSFIRHAGGILCSKCRKHALLCKC